MTTLSVLLGFECILSFLVSDTVWLLDCAFVVTLTYSFYYCISNIFVLKQCVDSGMAQR